MTVTVYLGTQGPKSPLSNFSPPALQTAVSTARTNFLAAVTLRGTHGYEGGGGASNGTTGFSYTGGTATWTNTSGSSNNRVVGALISDASAGRYNMTPGVVMDESTGEFSGHWLEAVGNFQYTFSTAINALAFYVTDLGDFDGTFSLTLYSGATVVYTEPSIVNTQVNVGGSGNGNLAFYGVVSTDAFDKAVFSITQSGSEDFVGFDQMMVGTVSASSNAAAAGSVPLSGAAEAESAIAAQSAGVVSFAGYALSGMPVGGIKDLPTWYYIPGPIPVSAEAWLKREFERVSQATYAAAPFCQYQVLHRPPLRPTAGMQVYADGTNWDPGSGEGAYIYKSSGVWSFLG